MTFGEDFIESGDDDDDDDDKDNNIDASFLRSNTKCSRLLHGFLEPFASLPKALP